MRRREEPKGRDWYFHWTITLQSEEDKAADPNAGYGAGSQMSFYGITDEQIEQRAELEKKYLVKEFTRLRDIENERARQEAAPFWRKWLGGV